MIKIYIDLETIQATEQSDIDYLINHIKPAAACKSDEAKAKSIAKQAGEVVEKSVFNGDFGSIITVGFAIEDSVITTYQRTDSVTEVDTLQSFFDTLKDVRDNSVSPELDMKWIAHNKAFDFKFLWKRCVINGINTHGIRIPHNDKHGTQHAFCTMEEWNGYGAKTGGSLDLISHVMGIKGKQGMSGADVWPAWRNKEYDRIATYCADDVRILREIYKRMTFQW